MASRAPPPSLAGASRRALAPVGLGRPRPRARPSLRARSSPVRAAFRAPPRTCSSATAEARAVLRALREATSDATTASTPPPRRVRIELPLPPADRDTDDIVYLGLHGQAADWSGGMAQRFRVTKRLVEDGMLDGYDREYLGLLDRDADGMGVWKVTRSGGGPESHDATVVTHPADTTFGFFAKLLRGEYGAKVADPDHLIVVVNAFWSGAGEKVGQPWELGLRREARRVLSPETGDWEKVYCARRTRSAAGVEGTLVRAWPGPWRLYDAEGVRTVMEAETEPSNREMAEALNKDAGVREAAGFNRDASMTSRDDDVIT